MKLKKLLFFCLILLFGVFVTFMSTNVYAAEGNPDTSVEVQKNVVGTYNYTSDEGTAKYVLYSDNTYDVEVHDNKSGETMTGSGTYIIDGSVLITDLNGETFKLEINGSSLNPIEDSGEVVYPCKVIVNSSKGGDVLFDVTEGNVGDIATAYIKADFLFSVSSVQFNGVAIELSSEGKYQFTLVEGENVLSVEFIVNNEKLTEIANLINGVKEDGFASLFTVSNLLNLISWIITVFLSSGFFLTLIKNKKLKSKTVDEVVDIVKETLQSKNAQILQEFLQSLIGPTLEKITSKMDGVDECIRVLCRCFVLAQDDTPENRLAIIEELTKLNNSDEALTAQIRAIVKEEQKAQEERIFARDKAIEELKENNAKLIEDKGPSDSYGQI